MPVTVGRCRAARHALALLGVAGILAGGYAVTDVQPAADAGAGRAGGAAAPDGRPRTRGRSGHGRAALGERPARHPGADQERGRPWFSQKRALRWSPRGRRPLGTPFRAVQRRRATLQGPARRLPVSASDPAGVGESPSNTVGAVKE